MLKIIMKKPFFLFIFLFLVVIFNQPVLADNLLQSFTSKDINYTDNSTAIYWRTSSIVEKIELSYNCPKATFDRLHLKTDKEDKGYCGSEKSNVATWNNVKEGSVNIFPLNLSDLKDPLFANFFLTFKRNDGTVIGQSDPLVIRFNSVYSNAYDRIPSLSYFTSEESNTFGGSTLVSWMTKDADEVNLIVRNSSLTLETCLPQFKITNAETKELISCGNIDRRMPANGSIYLKFDNLNPANALTLLEIAPIRSSFTGTIPQYENLASIIPSKFVPKPVIVTPTPVITTVTAPVVVVVAAPVVSAADEALALSKAEALKTQIADLKKIIAELQRRIAEILAKRALGK